MKAKVIMAAGMMNKPKMAENMFTCLRWHKIAQAEILCNGWFGTLLWAKNRIQETIKQQKVTTFLKNVCLK
jgi:hypothetical protein